jgi:hypothetical protein
VLEDAEPFHSDDDVTVRQPALELHREPVSVAGERADVGQVADAAPDRDQQPRSPGNPAASEQRRCGRVLSGWAQL